jgi:iron complex outermembrane receptor protein
MPRFRLFVLSALLLPPTLVFAQQTNSSSSPSLPAVTVTAPSDATPAASVTTISIPTLQTPQIRQPENLSARVPNLAVSASGLHSFGDVYSIRGITNTIFFSDPAVAMYVDDVPAGDAFTFFEPLYHIENVNVFRGPQPALFGLNSEAGLFDIQTVKAGNEWHGSASGSYSSFNTQDYRLSLSGPLVKDKLTISAAGDWGLSDGFIYNSFLKRRTDSRNDLNGRVVLTWTPAPDWRISAGIEGGRASDGAEPLVSLKGNPLTVSSDIPGSLSTYEHHEWLDITKSFETWQARAILSHSNFNINPQEQDLDLTSASVKLAGIFPGTETFIPEASEIRRQQETWSAELRFESLPKHPAPPPESDGKNDLKNYTPPTPEDPFHWRVGFFFQEKDTDGNDLRSFSAPFSLDVPVVFGPFSFLAPITVYTPIAQRTQYSLREDTFALYGNAGYSWGPLDIDAGVRVDYTRKTLSRGEDDGLGDFFAFSGEYDDWTAAPTLGLTFHVNKNLDLFARTTYGFKPGGFSPYTDNPDLTGYKRERDWASEVGIHAKALDGKLQGTLTGYYSHIDNYQVERTFSATDYLVANAGRAESYGVEFETSLEVVHGLTISGNIGYNQTNLYDYHDPITGADLSGNRAPYVPNFTALAALDYAHDCGFRAHVEYVVMGDTDYTDTNDTHYRQNTYGLLNAQIGYERGNYGVYLFGRNLADKRYFTLKESDINAGVIGEPRVLGVKAELKF